MSLIIRLPGSGSLTVKHVIRTDIHHFNVQFSAHFGNVSGPVRVDPAAYFHIVLSRVHSRISGAVNHRVHIGFSNHLIAGGPVSDVHLLHINAHRIQTAFYHLVYDVMAKLAFYARH